MRVSILDGINVVQPCLAGWDLSLVSGPLAEACQRHGMEITEGVREIVREGELPSEFYDEFILRARFTEAVPAGKIVHVPVVKDCATSAER